MLCSLCHFTVELDDAFIETAHGRCICVACYHREVGDAVRVGKLLRSQIVALMSGEAVPGPQPGDADYFGTAA